jgi:hypothetical protein
MVDTSANASYPKGANKGFTNGPAIGDCTPMAKVKFAEFMKGAKWAFTVICTAGGTSLPNSNWIAPAAECRRAHVTITHTKVEALIVRVLKGGEWEQQMDS